MFNKIKARKAPLSLSSVSNAIKSVGTTDLSPDVAPKNLKITVGDQLGLPADSITAVAYDPVQSLLAVCTRDNAVRVYGQQSVEVVFEFKTALAISHLRFVKGVYLACVQTLGTVTVLSLQSKKILASYLTPGAITAVESDPSMDWLVLGMQNGAILFFDVDRFALTPFRVDNLQKLVMPKQKLSPVLALEWHPRDIGTLLVTYSHCAVQYLISGGDVKCAFVYQLTKEARGFEYSMAVDGTKKRMFGSVKEVIPALVEAHYHPNGLHVVTVHVDGTLVFWDASGTLLEARTIKETSLHKPGPPPPSLNPEDAPESIRVKWVAGQDPEITQLVVAGADHKDPGSLDILDFGYTLKYSLTSHEKQGEFYVRPTDGQRKIAVRFYGKQLQTNPEHISHILPLAADAQPYFDGGHNPTALILVTNVGGLYLVPFSETAAPDVVLPPSIAAIAPPVRFSGLQTIKRVEWFSILSKKGPSKLLRGGAPVNHNYPHCVGFDETLHNIMITGHENGSVRMLDLTSGEYHDDERLVQLNLKNTLDDGSSSSYRITQVSCAFESREMLVGLVNGNVAICKFAKLGHDPARKAPAKTGYELCPVQHENGDVRIVSISNRVLGLFGSHSFVPVSLLQLGSKEPISCLKMSNAGFGAIAYKSGRLVVCDITRGPAVILNLESIIKHLPSVTGECYITTLEFAIMEYGQDGFSSLILMAGTNAGGNLLLFKIVPLPNGGFDAVFTDKSIGLNYKGGENSASGLDAIIPVNSANGRSAVATLDLFRRLSQGIVVPGLLLVSSQRDLRVLKTPKQKLAHKVVDEACVGSGIIQFRTKGMALATVTRSGFVKLFSLPGLSDIADVKIPTDTYARIQKNGGVTSATVLCTGEIVLRLNATEHLSLLLFDDTKARAPKEPTSDLLFNDTAIIPPRPTAGALLWAKGQTSYISSKDLTILLAGPNRKPAKHPESQLAYNISPEANPNQSYGAYSGSGAPGSKGDSAAYAEPVRKSTQTNPYAFGTLGFLQSMRDGMDAVEESVNSYANGFSESMTETVESQKRSMYTLAFKSKFGF